MRKQIELMLLETLKENIQDEQLLEDLQSNFSEFRIISNVDSLTLVSILVDFESKIQDEFGLAILISSERAMSERGPFYDVQNLLSFTESLIKEEKV